MINSWRYIFPEFDLLHTYDLFGIETNSPGKHTGSLKRGKPEQAVSVSKKIDESSKISFRYSHIFDTD